MWIGPVVLSVDLWKGIKKLILTSSPKPSKPETKVSRVTFHKQQFTKSYTSLKTMRPLPPILTHAFLHSLLQAQVYEEKFQIQLRCRKSHTDRLSTLLPNPSSSPSCVLSVFFFRERAGAEGFTDDLVEMKFKTRSKRHLNMAIRHTPSPKQLNKTLLIQATGCRWKIKSWIFLKLTSEISAFEYIARTPTGDPPYFFFHIEPTNQRIYHFTQSTHRFWDDIRFQGTNN